MNAKSWIQNPKPTQPRLWTRVLFPNKHGIWLPESTPPTPPHITILPPSLLPRFKNKFQLPRRRRELIPHLRLHSPPPFSFMAVLPARLHLVAGSGVGCESNAIFARQQRGHEPEFGQGEVFAHAGITSFRKREEGMLDGNFFFWSLGKFWKEEKKLRG